MARGGLDSGEHLADQIKVPPNRINGQRAITGDTALRLGHFFGNTPQFWLNLQLIYDLRVAEKKAGAVIRTMPKLGSRGTKLDRQAQPA